MASTAHADDFIGELSASRSNLVRQEWGELTDNLKAARSSAAQLDAIGRPELLARTWLYEGVAAWVQDGPDQAERHELAMEAWRQGFIIHSALQWDRSLLNDHTAESLFILLGKEVGDRAQVSAQVPDATGAAELWVDGVRVRHGAMVPEGLHLAQVRCPDNSIHGRWTHFDRKMKWLKLCPGGVDTTVMVAEEAPTDWFSLDPLLTADGPPPTPDVPQPALELAATRAPVHEPPAVTWSGGSLPLGVGAGLLGLAAGGMAYWTHHQRQAFMDPENPNIESEADVDAMAASVNRSANVATALGASAAGMAGLALYFRF
jgi:hypothetical protein